MIETILIIALILALAAAFVFASMWREEKKKAQAEHNCYLAALRIGNQNAYTTQDKEEKRDLLSNYVDYLNERCNSLQDFKSSVLCPTNNHVWLERTCIKCGKEKPIC